MGWVCPFSAYQRVEIAWPTSELLGSPPLLFSADQVIGREKGYGLPKGFTATEDANRVISREKDCGLPKNHLREGRPLAHSQSHHDVVEGQSQFWSCPFADIMGTSESSLAPQCTSCDHLYYTIHRKIFGFHGFKNVGRRALTQEKPSPLCTYLKDHLHCRSTFVKLGGKNGLFYL